VATAGKTPPADRIPVDLSLLGGDAEELFDAAYAADWDVAQEAVGRIQNAEQRLAPLPDADLAEQLAAQIRGAREHVQSRLRIDTMQDANAMSRIVAELTKHYVTGGAPNAAMLLGYYGRQLEIGIAGSRPDVLTHARTDLKTVWNTLRPEVESRGDSEDAKRFTDTIVALDGAKRPSDYVAPTRAELAEAARIEKLFE
jgi:hypothetical protein